MLLVKTSHMGPRGTAIGGRRGGPKVVQNDFSKGFEACLYKEKNYIVVYG
jgi:hypothetical protein